MLLEEYKESLPRNSFHCRKKEFELIAGHSSHLLRRGRHINPRHPQMSLKWTFNITHVYSLRKASINIIEPAPCLTLFSPTVIYVCTYVFIYVCTHGCLRDGRVKSTCFGGERLSWVGYLTSVSFRFLVYDLPTTLELYT